MKNIKGYKIGIKNCNIRLGNRKCAERINHSEIFIEPKQVKSRNNAILLLFIQDINLQKWETKKENVYQIILK